MSEQNVQDIILSIAQVTGKLEIIRERLFFIEDTWKKLNELEKRLGEVESANRNIDNLDERMSKLENAIDRNTAEISKINMPI